VEATELYDNQTDPREINNIVNAPGYSALVNELKQKLSAGWQKALLHEAK
jgi:N-sulfoglucosamine sulfohydrolase-like protein